MLCKIILLSWLRIFSQRIGTNIENKAWNVVCLLNGIKKKHLFEERERESCEILKTSYNIKMLSVFLSVRGTSRMTGVYG